MNHHHPRQLAHLLLLSLLDGRCRQTINGRQLMVAVVVQLAIKLAIKSALRTALNHNELGGVSLVVVMQNQSVKRLFEALREFFRAID